MSFFGGIVGITEKKRRPRLCEKSRYCLSVLVCTYSKDDLTQSGGWWEKPWWLLMHVIAEGHQQAIHSNWWTPIYWSVEPLQRLDEGSLREHMLSLRGCCSTVQPWEHDIMLLYVLAYQSCTISVYYYVKSKYKERVESQGEGKYGKKGYYLLPFFFSLKVTIRS